MREDTPCVCVCIHRLQTCTGPCTRVQLTVGDPGGEGLGDGGQGAEVLGGVHVAGGGYTGHGGHLAAAEAAAGPDAHVVHGDALLLGRLHLQQASR